MRLSSHFRVAARFGFPRFQATPTPSIPEVQRTRPA
jgi:hypothetical protein